MTTSSIRDLIRILIDEPTTAKISNANLNALIYSEYRDLINEITRRNADYYLKSDTVSTTAATAFTTLPTDCTILKKLIDSDGKTVRWCKSSQFDHTAANSKPTCFDVNGRRIWWSPTPDTVYSFTAYYHYKPSDMSTDASVPELPPDFHDILAYGVAVKSRLSKENDIRGYWEIYEKKKDNLLQRVGMSQTNNAKRVIRVWDESEQ